MPITRQKDWDVWVKGNTDPYGKCCVDVARKVMEILDEENEFDPHTIINQADDTTGSGGITGFMAGCIAQMVSRCHSRGDEFLSAWNGDVQCKDEGTKATEKGVALNLALLTIGI